MPHTNLIFSPPFLTNWGFPKKSPRLETQIQTPKSKRGEIRYSAQPYPIWSWDWPVNFMRGGEQVANSDYQYLLSFFLSMGGMLSDFLYQDPYDNSVNNCYFGIADGTTTQFQLTRMIGIATDIVQNLNGTPTIYVNGSAVYSSSGPNPLLNPAFASGNTGWNTEAGWSIVSGAGPAGEPYVGEFIGPGTSAIVNNKQVPCSPGVQVTASCQGKGSVGANGTTAVRLSFYNSGGTLIGGTHDSGSITADASWHGQSVTATAPAGTAYLLVDYAVYTSTNSTPWFCSEFIVSMYSMGSNGTVVFNAAPPTGAVLTWSGSYFYRCRFDTDALDFEQMMDQLWTIGSLKMISVIL